MSSPLYGSPMLGAQPSFTQGSLRGLQQSSSLDDLLRRLLQAQSPNGRQSIDILPLIQTILGRRNLLGYSGGSEFGGETGGFGGLAPSTPGGSTGSTSGGGYGLP